MDLGSILIAAVLGGVFGGIGGFLAHRIGKRLPVKLQLVSTICGLAGFAVAFAVTPIVKSALSSARSGAASSASSSPTLAPTSVAVARFDGELRSSSRMFRLVAEEWPEEYQAFVATVAKQTDQTAANRIANEFTTTLRKSNSELSLYVSDDGLRSFFQHYQTFLSELNAREGNAVCTAVLNRGPAALEDRANDYLVHLDQMGLDTMKLLASGRDRRKDGAEATSDVSQADLDAFDGFLIDRTGEQGLLLKFRSGSAPDLCNIGIHVMKALSEFAPDQSAGHALRTATFHNIASS